MLLILILACLSLAACIDDPFDAARQGAAATPSEAARAEHNYKSDERILRYKRFTFLCVYEKNMYVDGCGIVSKNVREMEESFF